MGNYLERNRVGWGMGRHQYYLQAFANHCTVLNHIQTEEPLDFRVSQVAYKRIYIFSNSSQSSGNLVYYEYSIVIGLLNAV